MYTIFPLVLKRLGLLCASSAQKGTQFFINNHTSKTPLCSFANLITVNRYNNQ